MLFEIDSRRQSANDFGRRNIAPVATIGTVRNPAVPKFGPPGITRPSRRFLAIKLSMACQVCNKKLG